MTKFFFEFKKTHFPNFWSKKIFFQKNRAVMQNFIRVSGTMTKFREIRENTQTDVRREEWTDPIS